MEEGKQSFADRRHATLMRIARTERLISFQGASSAHIQAAGLVLLVSIIFVAPPIAPAQVAPWKFWDWSIEQLPLRIGPGGRANTIAVHPKNNNFILVASESGGLFRSENGGKTWTHVDSLPVFYTNAVAFAKDPKFVIVTASEDFSVSNRGGVWRSSDEGKSWTQVPSPSAPAGVGDRFSAFEISIAPDTGNIYVATTYGVSTGDPEGKIGSWKHYDPFGTGDRKVSSVIALPKTAQGGNLVLAGGPAGIRRSTDGGTQWHTAKSPGLATADNVVKDMHAFARSPVANNQAYVVVEAALDENQQKSEKLTCIGTEPGACGYIMLYSTTNGGDTWEQLYIAPKDIWRPGGGGCGGIAFVKAIKRGGNDAFIDLYVSNRCSISKGVKVPTINLGGISIKYEWAPFIEYPTTSDAGDTRDLAFNSQNEPVLAATDGGLIKPPQPGVTPVWTFAGDKDLGNPANGYNALQIYEVQGQWIGSLEHNLYFGTQDNSLWSTAGYSWTACCNEGGFFEGEYHVPWVNDAQITFSTGFDPNGNCKLQGMLFTNGQMEWSKSGVDTWQNPAGIASGWPKIIWKNFHVQGVESYEATGPLGITIEKFKRGLAFTTDAFTTNLSQKWKQYAIIDDDRADLPRLSIPENGTPVLYQAIRTDVATGFLKIEEKDALARIVKKKNAEDASVSYPLMKKFGNFGWGPTMNTNYRVFAADPRDAMHLIASDTTSGKMMETTNGGNEWTEIQQLTPLVTDGGKLKFLGWVFFNGTDRNHLSGQASAISFYPDDPNLVAVGTVQNGIFISNDRGKHWRKVPRSEQATVISSFHWRRADDLLVATYGRGLWRVRFKFSMPFSTRFCESPDCFHIYYQRPPGDQPTPYDHVAAAYGGRIVGARIADGIVEELFVEPSTTIVFATDSQELPRIKVTETTRPMGFDGLTRMPRPPEGARVITGVTLKKRREKSELIGFLFSPRTRSMYVPQERGEGEERPVGRIESPTAGKPYLEVLSGSVTSPRGTIQLAGRNLTAGKPVEIAIDGNTVHRIAANREGKFSTVVKAPTQFGLYRLTLIDSASRKVLNGALISIRPDDKPRRR